MDNRAINFNREQKQFATGKSGTNRISTNGSKLVSMQEQKAKVERSVIDVIDYRILRKSGALSK